MATVRTALGGRIAIDPEIMVGKPVVAGTRMPVYVVLQQLAAELDLDTFFKNYPHLTPEQVQACLEYAAARLEHEEIHFFEAAPGPSASQ